MTDNAYATPKSDVLDTSHQPSIDRAINGEYDFQIGAVIKEAWNLTDGVKITIHTGLFIYIVVYMLLMVLMTTMGLDPAPYIEEQRMAAAMAIGMLPGLLSIPIVYPMLAGIIMMGIDKAAGRETSISRVFQYFSATIPLTVMAIIMTLLIYLGFMLLIIPGIYLSIAYLMAIPLIVEKDLGAWEALEVSRKSISKHWFKFFFLLTALMLIMIVSMLPLLIGTLWTVPMMFTAIGVLYRDTYGIADSH